MTALFVSTLAVADEIINLLTANKFFLFLVSNGTSSNMM